jgi:uncharacterized membrane protein
MGNRIAPARFVLFAVLLIAGSVVGALALRLGWMHGIMLGFDVASIVFLGVCVPLLRDKAKTMRRHALENDANRPLLLAVTVAVSFVIMVTVGAELMGGEQLSALRKALVIVTLTLSWLFSNVIYALHYAHLYYRAADGGGDRGGIDFPGTKEPDYSDFVYFSFTLGMTFQTSDTDITSPTIRRIAIAHSFAAFVFNLGVIAFTINVLGS